MSLASFKPCLLYTSDLGDVGRYRINRKLNLTTDMDVRVLNKEDIIEIIKYLIELINSKADVDVYKRQV